VSRVTLMHALTALLSVPDIKLASKYDIKSVEHFIMSLNTYNF